MPAAIPGPEDTPTQPACQASPCQANPCLVRLDRITMRYGGAVVFSALSFCLRRGERLALLGANGAGKSTLLRLIQGELRPAQNAGALPGQDAPGRIFWNFEGREEPYALTALKHARLVSPGQQRDYLRRNWNITGGEIILSGLDNSILLQGEVSARHYARAAELAGAAGAEPLLGLGAPAMSQGQLRLILLLRALMDEPALLLLDEPFDGLDAAARQGITRGISLVAETGRSMILSAHRKEDIPPFVTGALLLRGGRIRRITATRGAPLPVTVPPEPFHFETAPGAATKAAADPGAINASNSRLTAGQSPPAPVWRQGSDDKSSRSISSVKCSGGEFQSQNALVKLEHVDVFINRRQVLFDINWRICPGDQWILSGGNGAGKSTLLRLLYGDECAAHGGSIRWKCAVRPSLADLRAGVGYVSDRLQQTYGYDLSAEDLVISGLRGSIGLYHEPDERERALARGWLERLGLGALGGKNFYSLSDGTARRVLLARALAASPPLLLLDEPCSGLDARSRELFLDLLPSLAGQGVSIVLATHQERDKGRLFTHELRLEGGRVIFAGRTMEEKQ